MKILVTGGAGFIGSFLIRELLWRSNDVISIDNFNDYYDRKCKEFNLDLINKASNQELEFFLEEEINPVAKKLFSYYKNSDNNNNTGKFEFIEGDIRNIDFLKEIFSTHKIDAIIHLAAMAGVPKSTKLPILYTEVNVLGTTNLQDLSVRYKIKKFVFASSSSVYGHRTDKKVKESDKLFPSSIYGATKVAGEQLCHAFAKSFGLNFSIARIFGPIYGPLQRPYGMLAQRVINYAHNDKILQIYGKNGLETAKDSTYIDDEVNGLILCLDNCQGYQIFNIGTGNPVTIRETIDSVEKLSKNKIQFTIIDLDQSDVSSSADISKAKSLLNYSPKSTFQEGIKKQIEIFNLMPKWYQEMDV